VLDSLSETRKFIGALFSTVQGISVLSNPELGKNGDRRHRCREQRRSKWHKTAGVSCTKEKNHCVNASNRRRSGESGKVLPRPAHEDSDTSEKFDVSKSEVGKPKSGVTANDARDRCSEGCCEMMRLRVKNPCDRERIRTQGESVGEPMLGDVN